MMLSKDRSYKALAAGLGLDPRAEQRMLPPEPLCLRVEGDGRSDAWMVRPPPSCLLNSHWLQRESLEMQWLETRGHSNCPGSAEIR